MKDPLEAVALLGQNITRERDLNFPLLLATHLEPEEISLGMIHWHL